MDQSPVGRPHGRRPIVGQDQFVIVGEEESNAGCQEAAAVMLLEGTNETCSKSAGSYPGDEVTSVGGYLGHGRSRREGKLTFREESAARVLVAVDDREVGAGLLKTTEAKKPTAVEYVDVERAYGRPKAGAW